MYFIFWIIFTHKEKKSRFGGKRILVVRTIVSSAGYPRIFYVPWYSVPPIRRRCTHNSYEIQKILQSFIFYQRSQSLLSINQSILQPTISSVPKMRNNNNNSNNSYFYDYSVAGSKHTSISSSLLTSNIYLSTRNYSHY